MKNKKIDKKDGIIRGLAISTGVLSLSTIGFGIGYAMMQSQNSSYGTQLENVYQKNLYNLVDGVNNIETKLSKILICDNTDLQNKLLMEVTKNTELAQQSIASLPISQGNIFDSVRFINQVGGYTDTLAKQIAKGKNLSKEDKDTLNKIKQSVNSMKGEINRFIEETKNDYSVLENSLDLSDENINSFTIRISKIKGEDVEYPTMIYDGPFSDSQTNIDIKGLSGKTITQEESLEILKNLIPDQQSYDYIGEINSKIETFNYKINNKLGRDMYAQISKIGGHLITLSGTSDSSYLENIDMEEGEKIALDFAKINGITDCICVWKDSLNNNGYFNIAPMEKGVILYPDLIKVKIDLSSGEVIGFDSSTYYTNHVKRVLPKTTILLNDAKKKIPQDYNFSEGRLTLIPLEYSREVLCYEFIGEKNGSTYYYYINAQTGVQENILKVIETTDGSKLM